MIGKSLVLSGTLVLSALVGTASADLRPPAEAEAAAAKSAKALAAPAPAVPTFVNGMAQAVFATGEANWVNHELWVESTFDSDLDGKLDRIHVDVSRPRETDTEGLKVPVIFEDSPYYADGGASPNWTVDHELGATPAARIKAPYFTAANTSPRISTAYESTWVPRGFAVVHAESPGSGNSDGCTTSGAPNETLGAVAVIDWLNGRAKGYTTRAGTTEVAATWTTGKTAMMGTSYNGTIPIAAATTGVQGLEAIVPISAISDWYDYYRANGMVRAPHSAAGGAANNSYLGEDLDVLAEYTYSRNDEAPGPRLKCWPVINDITATQDRLTGNRNAAWDSRNYMKDADKIKAAVLLAHGGNDFNVMTKNAAQLYAKLKANNVPREFYFHQGGHGGAPPDAMLNRWFSKYLYGVNNGVETLPKSWVVREAATCPPRQSTVTGDQSNTATITVASSAAFMAGQTLTIPVTSATGAITNPTSIITNVPDATHVTVTAAQATAAGSKIAGGASVSLACGTANPTPYAEWPDPAAANAVLKLAPGGASRGGLGFNGGAATETLTDDAGIADTALRDAATSPSRLIYQTGVLNNDLRISGTPTVSLNVAFSKTRANLSAALVSYPATGTTGGVILTRGWKDPENRTSDYVSDPIVPGTAYQLSFDMQAKDAIVPAGRRLALMVFSSDRQYTIRPAAGTQLTLDLGKSSFTIPVVGGQATLAAATGTAFGDVGGAVPATLALTMGAPASFGPFVPGLAKEYTATTTATVVSTAGDATLTVADNGLASPGRLVNGGFALPQPLQGLGVVKTWAAPTSNEAVPVTFKQAIGATDALRTGAYSKTLTFTLSTTTP